MEETGNKDKFGVVRTISKEVNTPGQSRGFAIMTNSEQRTGENRNTGLGDALADPEVYSEKTSRQRIRARISTSTKLPGTDRVTPPLVTPLVDNGVALEEALNSINQGMIWTRDALVPIAVQRTIMYQHAQLTNKA